MKISIFLKIFLNRILSKGRVSWQKASPRSKLAAKNIIATVLLKGVTIITSLLIVPITIDYINGSQYGIWLTISSIVAWTQFFDLGLANGFRNRFAEAKARGNITLAVQYVSTSYALISVLMVVLFGATIIINECVNWASVLNVSQSYSSELAKVFIILSFIFCMNMIANIFIKLMEADQHPAIGSVISCCGQILSLIAIYLLTKLTEGSLYNLALFFAGIPLITMVVASTTMFIITRYKVYRPRLSAIRFTLTRDLLGLGSRFFFIYLCLIAIFQLMNIVLSRECGSYAVTQYNIAFKYFSIVYMFAVIVLNPMWSAFTDAYTKRDFVWMKSTLHKLEKGIVLSIVICLLMLAVSTIAYKIWVGDKVVVPILLSVVTMVYLLSQVFGAVYMQVMCGIGAVRIQFLVYLAFATITYPLMTLCCRAFGIAGIVIIPTMVYLVQGILGRIQIRKVLDGTAKGIWIK